MIVFIYAVLVFLVLRFSVTLFNFLSNPKLGYYGKHFTDKVSIIILPGTDATELLHSIEQQDYEYIELIVLNDPDGADQFIERSTGKYLLFLDAGTTIEYGLINNLIYRTKMFDLALLSLIPTYKTSGFLKDCVYLLNDFLLLNLLPLRLVRLSSHPAFTASGNGCLFFNAELYKQHAWHDKIKSNGSGIIEIVKLVKQQQLKVEVLLANKFIYNIAGSINGPAERILLNFGNNIFIALIYLTLVIVGPVLIVINFNPVFVILPLGLIFLSKVMIAFLTAQNPIRNILLHPIQMFLLLFFTLKAICKRLYKVIKPQKSEI